MEWYEKEGDQLERVAQKFKEIKAELRKFTEKIESYAGMNRIFKNGLEYADKIIANLKNLVKHRPWINRMVDHYNLTFTENRAEIQRLMDKFESAPKKEFKTEDYPVKFIVGKLENAMRKLLSIKKPPPPHKLSYQALFAVDPETGNRLNLSKHFS